jgi:hypothetical protein
MTLSQLRALRQRLDTLFYFSFESLTDEQRLAFRYEIDEIDSQIRAFEEF